MFKEKAIFGGGATSSHQTVLLKWRPIDAIKMYRSQKNERTFAFTLFSSGGDHSPTKTHICTRESVGTFQTRAGTFETRKTVQSKKNQPKIGVVLENVFFAEKAS